MSGQRPMSEMVPWMFPLGEQESTIITKDSSLLAAFRIHGLDGDSASDEDVNQVADLLDRAYQVFANLPVTIWWRVDRRRTFEYPGGEFEDPVSSAINGRWREEFMSGENYVNTHHLSVALHPAKGEDRFWERVQHYMAEGENPLKAAVKAVRSMFSDNVSFQYVSAELARAHERFEEAIGSFMEALPLLSVVRLSGAELHGYLKSTISANENTPVKVGGKFMDGYLPDSEVEVGTDLLKLTGDKSFYIGAISIKAPPEETFPGMLDALLSIPGEITVSQVFRFAPKEKVSKHISSIYQYNDMRRYSARGYLSAAMKGGDFSGVRENPARATASIDANEALGEVSVNREFYGWHHLSVLARSESAEKVEALLRDVSSSLRYVNLVPVREKLHLLSTFVGAAPGQWKEIQRWIFSEIRSLSDLTPYLTVREGEKQNRYLSQQTGRPCEALTVLPTDFLTPFYFNFHSGDLGHTLVVGPSRTGKSVVMNFLISQYRKYGAKVFIFDKDFSCRIPTLLQGGEHINLAIDGGNVKLNPLAALAEKDGIEWVANWVEILITSRGYRISADDSRLLMEAVEGVAGHDEDGMWRLLSVYTLLPPHLQAELEPWVGDRPLARYFDNVTDSFSVSDFSCAEMGDILSNPIVSTAFMEYAFYRIKKELAKNRTQTPVPAIIYLEECWFLLDNPAFSDKIRDWLKTLAKLNAIVVMATQSLEDIANSSVFASIRDNVPTRIFLPNPNATTESLRNLYARQFDLNDVQIVKIARAIPKRQYFVVQPGVARMVNVSFPPDILAVLRSDSVAQYAFSRTYSADDDSWKQRYLEEIRHAV